ncbi:hypothetical protein SAMN04488561_0407 [Jiangella alba]|uniref:Uncharacterized protein n=1 Tax=Jiangella alba TaxID=561176 RepID=A0A1H5DH00_9ACTN|nr:hypothetical protein SAMN04488561_0407 [Jiangella alba]
MRHLIRPGAVTTTPPPRRPTPGVLSSARSVTLTSSSHVASSRPTAAVAAGSVAGPSLAGSAALASPLLLSIVGSAGGRLKRTELALRATRDRLTRPPAPPFKQRQGAGRKMGPAPLLARPSLRWPLTGRGWRSGDRLRRGSRSTGRARVGGGVPATGSAVGRGPPAARGSGAAFRRPAPPWVAVHRPLAGRGRRSGDRLRRGSRSTGRSQVGGGVPATGSAAGRGPPAARRSGAAFRRPAPPRVAVHRPLAGRGRRSGDRLRRGSRSTGRARVGGGVPATGSTVGRGPPAARGSGAAFRRPAPPWVAVHRPRAGRGRRSGDRLHRGSRSAGRVWPLRGWQPWEPSRRGGGDGDMEAMPTTPARHVGPERPQPDHGTRRPETRQRGPGDRDPAAANPATKARRPGARRPSRPGRVSGRPGPR